MIPPRLFGKRLDFSGMEIIKYRKKFYVNKTEGKYRAGQKVTIKPMP